MEIEKRREFIINAAYLSIILILAYLIIKYFLGVLFPFVLGFIIAFVLRPLIKWINKKVKINNKIIALIVLLVFYSLIGTGLFFLILKMFTMLKSLFEDIPQMYISQIQPLINQFSIWANDIFYRINPDILDFVQGFDESIIEQLGSIVKNFSSGAISLLTSMIKKLPNFFLGFVFTIISSFFITLDYKKITKFLSYQITGKNRELFSSIKRNGIDVVLNFLKAYGILLTVTFIEASIGLTLLNRENAIGVSLIIALVDILPVVGTGTILIPWSLIELFNGNIPDAIGLGVLYAVITIIRQVLEPRVIGDSIGLYPLVTLIAMFLGVKYFGVIGLLGLPIVITIIVKLHEEGIIDIWRDPNKKEQLSKNKDF